MSNDMSERLRFLATDTNTRDFLREVATTLDYHEAQDALLTKAQDEVTRLRDELAEVKRPLDAEMARLNANLITANERADSLVADSAMLAWIFATSAAVMEFDDGFSCVYRLPNRSGKFGPVADTKRGAVEAAMKEFP